MSETIKPKHSNSDTDRRAFGEKLDEFQNALNLLYIKKNQSGRLRFAEKWRGPAEYIFGADLLDIDTRGPTPEERALRSELEESAEDRRIELKQVLAELREKSVASGVLQFEYVGKIIEQYGGEIACIFFAENIIERVSPGLLAKLDGERRQREAELEVERQQAEDAIRARAQGLPPDTRVRPQKAEAMPRTAIEIPDEVRPIDAASDASALAPPATSEPVQAPPAPVAEPIQTEAPPPSVSEIVAEALPASALPAQHAPPVLSAGPAVFPKPPKGSCREAFSRAVSASDAA